MHLEQWLGRARQIMYEVVGLRLVCSRHDAREP
jgi:hypothetical protein